MYLKNVSKPHHQTKKKIKNTKNQMQNEKSANNVIPDHFPFEPKSLIKSL